MKFLTSVLQQHTCQTFLALSCISFLHGRSTRLCRHLKNSLPALARVQLASSNTIITYSHCLQSRFVNPTCNHNLLPACKVGRTL